MLYEVITIASSDEKINVTEKISRNNPHILKEMRAMIFKPYSAPAGDVSSAKAKIVTNNRNMEAKNRFWLIRCRTSGETTARNASAPPYNLYITFLSWKYGIHYENVISSTP